MSSSSSSSTMSSASSSSSSFDSSSSSSSSSFIYSSSSSTSVSSSSSLTSQSTSSSSSIDSSSESSESFLNFSTSSSSSFEIWNKGKPLILANSAIATALIENRLAQTISISDTTYEIGTVHCYLMGSYGIDPSYQINLGVYTCDDDGKPQTLLSSVSLDGTTILSDGWYDFAFGLNGTTPANGYISFVMWQTNGDENNYAMWAYGYYTGSSTSSDVLNVAWISNDNLTWVKDWNVSRGLRITGSYQAFNLEEAVVETPPATDGEIQLAFNERRPSYNRTKIEGNNLVLDYPNLLASFVVDSSGSMGWNDRFNNRGEIVSGIVDSFQQEYPSDVVFDFVTFGAKTAESTSVNSNIGQITTINLDLHTPTRTTYEFVVSDVNIEKDAVYSHNDYSYVVYQTMVGTNILTCLGDGTPLLSGLLTKISGGGADNIEFTSYNSVTIDNNVMAYGFKNMISGHTYIVSDVQVDGIAFDVPTIENWELYHPNSQSPSVSLTNDGPEGTDSISILSTTNLSARKLFLASNVISTSIVTNIPEGGTSVEVDDVSIFTIDTHVDLVNGSIASTNHQITDIDTVNNVFSISPSCSYLIKNNIEDNGRAEISLVNNSRFVTGTTIQLLVKDALADSDSKITFFLQSVTGLIMEWDFVPFNEWKTGNLFWLDETAILPVNILDSTGNPFPDGTKVILEVDSRSSTENLLSQDFVPDVLTENASIGDTRIYVESLDGYAKDVVIDIMNSSNQIQTATIQEVGSDDTGFYIELYEPLQFDFAVSENSKIIVNDKGGVVVVEDMAVSVSLPLVDVTPIVAGRNLDPSLLKPYDKTPVDPLDTYASLNYSREHIQGGIVDMPVIDGIATVRVLPITEDVLKTNADKNILTENLLRGDPKEIYSTQEEQQNGDLDSITTPATSGTEQNTTQVGDYVIKSPIYLRNGHAESSMSTTAVDLTLTTFDGFNIAGLSEQDSALYSKRYVIYPSIVEETSTGVVKGIQFFDSFSVDFAAPINIHSEKSNNSVSFWCERYSGDANCSYFAGYDKKQVSGVYAGDGPFTINYTVSDRGILVKNGTLNIKIYSNTIVDQESAVCNTDSPITTTKQFINVKLDPVVKDVNGTLETSQPLSPIDSWRESVSSNPFSQVIDSSSPANDSDIIGSSQNGQILQQVLDSDYGKSLATIEFNTIKSEVGFYSNPLSWTNAAQYTVFETSINITNGKATLEIPANETVSVLFVEASYPFGNNRFEAIRGDLLFVANPLSIGAINPTYIKPTGNVEDKFEIGGKVTWKDDNDGVIDDGTLVKFSTITSANPSESVTDNGSVSGIFLGPHDLVVFDAKRLEEVCPPVGVDELIYITISHSSGWVNRITRRIVWSSVFEGEDEGKDGTFYFHVTGTGNAWSDGNITPVTNIVLDLRDGINGTDSWVGIDGVNRLEGYGQFEDAPRYINSGATVPSRLQINKNGTPLNFLDTGLNQSIGNYPKTDIPALPQSPWDKEIKMTTTYLDDQGHGKYGLGLTELPYPGASGLVFPRPLAKYEEPLGISVSMESFEETFNRDGVDTAPIVATVTWRGNPIKSKFTVNEGSDNETIIDFPFPFVTFEIGECSAINHTISDDPDVISQYIDYRGDFEGCLLIKKRADAQLSSYSIQASLGRTDVYIAGLDSHTHECSVDNNGNGITTSTIVLEGSVADHTHIISDYLANESDSHTHELRCVAVTELKPTLNINLAININAYVEYDPTNCAPYFDIGQSNIRIPSSGNRMMFSTYVVPGYTPSTPSLILDLKVYGNASAVSTEITSELPTFYVGANPGETARGFDIKAHAYFSEYYDYNLLATVPARDVDDGSRVSIDVDVFKPFPKVDLDGKGINTNLSISGPDVVKDYMILKVTGSIASEGKYGTAEKTIMISSNLTWLPDYRGRVSEPTSDLIYINNAISYINTANTIGSSQVFDALRLSAQRITEYQTDNPEFKDYKKIIFLLTDGDENTSQYSINQAIDSVSFIDGKGETQVIPARLGRSYSADEVILTKIYTDTNGFMVSSLDLTSSKISDLVSYVLGNSALGIGQGIYSNSFNLNQPSIPKKLFLTNVNAPDLTNVEFRYRTSINGKTWGLWSEWNKYTKEHSINEIIGSKTAYFEYEIKLFGDSSFNSPSVGSDLTCQYYNPSDFVIFFKPLDVGGMNASKFNPEGNKFVSSIHITHESDIPETSDIKYGVIQSDSFDFDTFYQHINPDEHTILLTRYNELLLTDDNRVYTALNGSWPAGVGISIYKINNQYPNGQLINSSLYAQNNAKGTITFYTTQDVNDKFVICVEVSPSIRIACKIVNYGSQQAIIHHVGVIYNMMQRIPTDAEGNIIHTSISSRIK